METVEALQDKLHNLTTVGHRNRLLARGLARGMIWRNGELPAESPSFSPVLTTDLLDHGFRILDSALSLRQLDPSSSHLDSAFRVAGEAIESAVRRGDSALVKSLLDKGADVNAKANSGAREGAAEGSSGLWNRPKRIGVRGRC